MVAWAFSSMPSHMPDSLLRASIDAVDEPPPGISARALSMLVWAHGSVGRIDRGPDAKGGSGAEPPPAAQVDAWARFFERAASRSVPLMAEFDAQSLAHLAAGFSFACEPRYDVPSAMEPPPWNPSF
jgi:hypothetical protein